MNSPRGRRHSSTPGHLRSPADWSEASDQAGGSWSGARRAPRYLMDLAIRYRPAGASLWSEGRTIDISRCGVLFAGEGPVLPAATAIELVIAMPDLDSLPGAQVHCNGHIVRLLPQSPIMASTIDAFSFEKGGEHS